MFLESKLLVVESFGMQLEQFYSANGATYTLQKCLEYSRKIKDSLILAKSIDNYIENHRGNEVIELIAKLAISKVILEEENKSKLRLKEHSNGQMENGFDVLNDTWYLNFFHLITENCALSDLPERFRKITLVIYNYDRCLEHFLFYAIKKYYDVNDVVAKEIILNLNIFHPYGMVGSLPWMGSDTAISFGFKPNHDQLLNVSGLIRTFTEGVDPKNSDYKELKKILNESEKFVFLGFGFHKLNMEIIRVDRDEALVSCYATVLDVHEIEQGAISSEIFDCLKIGGEPHEVMRAVDLLDNTCYEFFKNLSKSLSS